MCFPLFYWNRVDDVSVKTVKKEYILVDTQGAHREAPGLVWAVLWQLVEVDDGDVSRGFVVLFLRGIFHSPFRFLMHVMIILLCFIIFIWNFLKMAMHSLSQSCHMDMSVPLLISSKRKACFAFSESSSVRVTNTWTCGEMMFHFRPWQLGHLLWWWRCDVVRHLLQNSCGRLQCQKENNSGY